MASETYVGQKSNAHVLQSENPLLPNGRDNPQAVAMFAEALFKARHVFFPQGYFTDVSWQILLELFLARQTHTKVIVSDLCLEPKIAPTTVLRHLDRTVMDGYVRRVCDPHDKRKIYVVLTDHGDLVMTEALSHVLVVLSKLQLASKKLSVFL